MPTPPQNRKFFGKETKLSQIISFGFLESFLIITGHFYPILEQNKFRKAEKS